MKTIEERSKDLFIETIKLCKKIKITPINERIIKQVVASSGSVGANFQEASCAMSNKDFIKCLKISRKEVRETKHWLLGLAMTDANIQDDAQRLVKESEELNYILTSIISKQENKTKF